MYGSRTNNLRLAEVVRHMLEEGGVASLWRGNAINIVKVVPEMALKFMVYEQVGVSQYHLLCFCKHILNIVCLFSRWLEVLSYKNSDVIVWFISIIMLCPL